MLSLNRKDQHEKMDNNFSALQRCLKIHFTVQLSLKVMSAHMLDASDSQTKASDSQEIH